MQKPYGLTNNNGILFISNSDSNEILQYAPQSKTLDIFVHDTSDLIRPGGIGFGPENLLYVINENDSKIYRYDINKGNLLGVFADSPNSGHEPPNISLRSIVFSKNNQYMFASNPVEQ